MEHINKKWTSFSIWSEKGPYLVLITDYDWWDNNREEINDWFDRNCPICKPDRQDTIIQFMNKSQYTAWKMTWG